MPHYVTTNDGKLREAAARLGDSVEQCAFDYPERQASDVAPIAAHGARAAFDHLGGPVLVDDAGLFIDGFDGFPGPYSSFVEETLGVDRVGRICRRALDCPTARFRCVLAYCDGAGFDTVRGDPTARVADGDPPVALFVGEVSGRIVQPRGEHGFGYDPLFEHDGLTFGERQPQEKNEVSHRGRALDAFAAWYGRTDR